VAGEVPQQVTRAAATDYMRNLVWYFIAGIAKRIIPDKL
jgi:hypothetical protein